MSPLADLKYALRSLIRTPGLTVFVVITLALGIGANTAIFSVVRAVVLRPLPFPEPDRLMAICETGESAGDYCGASPPNAEDWARRSRSFETIGIGRTWPFTFHGQEGTEGVQGGMVTPGFLRAFRLEPLLGRMLQDQDLGRRVTVLGYGLWQSSFAADPGIVGQSLALDEESYTIVGVLPPEVRIPGLERARLWLPPTFDLSDEENRAWRGFNAVGRLRADATPRQARTEMSAIAARLAEQYAEANEGWGVDVVPLREEWVAGVSSTLWIFLGAVTLVLLIGCANVANLLLARSVERRRELAVRCSLGATRGRLVGLLLTESLVLAIAGGLFGTLIAHWAVAVFVALAPGGIPRLDQVSIDGSVLAFTLLLSIVTSALCGLVPALRAGRIDQTEALRQGRGASLWRSALGVRGGLVVCEVALALVLLIGAGLLTRSFASAASWKGGFDHRNLLTLWLYSSQGKYPEGHQIAELYQRAVAELEALPGVMSVGTASSGPLFGWRESGEIATADGSEDQTWVTNWFDVGPQYFQTMGIRLVAGRHFTAADREGAARVAMVNQTMARRLWPEGSAIGKRVSRVTLEAGVPMEVVGVVADVKPLAPNGEVEPEIYWPNLQIPRWATFMVVRTSSDPAGLAEPVRNRLLELDSELNLGRFATYERLISDRLVRPRFHMLLLGCFAAVALLLAVGGTYGVISYGVFSRRFEIGLRMAVGAGRRDILRLVVGQGLRLVIAGVGIGLAGALALTRVLTSMLYGVTATDPATFLAITGLLIAAALLASLLPARRAVGVDPALAMRRE